MGRSASGSELLMIFLWLLVGSFVWYMCFLILSGGRTMNQMLEDQKENEKKKEQDMIKRGASSREKYSEALKLYSEGNKMICEI